MDFIWIGIGLALVAVLTVRLVRINHHKEERALESLREVIEGRKIEDIRRPRGQGGGG